MLLEMKTTVWTEHLLINDKYVSLTSRELYQSWWNLETILSISSMFEGGAEREGKVRQLFHNCSFASYSCCFRHYFPIIVSVWRDVCPHMGSGLHDWLKKKKIPRRASLAHTAEFIALWHLILWLCKLCSGSFLFFLIFHRLFIRLLRLYWLHWLCVNGVVLHAAWVHRCCDLLLAIIKWEHKVSTIGKDQFRTHKWERTATA